MTPPTGRKPKPPGTDVSGVTVVFAPTIVEAIGDVVEALKPAPPAPDYTELITALINAIRLHTSVVTDQTAAIRDHAEAIRENSKAIGVLTGVVSDLTVAINNGITAIHDVVEAIDELTDAVIDATPKPPTVRKATKVVISRIVTEPLSS